MSTLKAARDSNIDESQSWGKWFGSMTAEFVERIVAALRHSSAG